MARRRWCACLPRRGCKVTVEGLVSAFPVGILVIVIGWSWAAFVFRVCFIAISDTWGLALLAFIIYHILFVPFVYSYYKAVTISPGKAADPDYPAPFTNIATNDNSSDNNLEASVSAASLQDMSVGGNSTISWRPNFTNSFGEASLPFIRQHRPTVQVKRDGRKRFCKKCQLYKYDRAHHCRSCRSCVLKMDHHCPWLNNCVGHRNHKYFYLFILYACLYSSFLCLVCVPITLRIINEPNGLLTLDLNLPFLVLIAAVFDLFLMPFVAFHTYQIMRNRTTIESYEYSHFGLLDGWNPRNPQASAEVTRSRHLNMWDLGWRENWMQVMGRSPCLWFLPVANSLGNGKSFPVNNYAYSSLQTAIDEDDREHNEDEGMEGRSHHITLTVEDGYHDRLTPVRESRFSFDKRHVNGEN